MNTDFTKVLPPLPPDLQARLDLIIQTTPHFWEQRRYNHFTNHGPSHSERVHRQKLAQLAQELPEDRRLTTDEVFIVSAAAWLYEIGMQSPNLKPILGFDYQPGDSLSFSQLQEIREKKHLLTERLIIDSVRSDYQGPSLQLGLTRPADDYTRLIAEVCRWCSDEPLENVPEKLPVQGIPVRLRLLVALLRLADQLYIDSSRVNLDLLQRAKLPTRQLARWWAYHYAQTLPIVSGQIRFHYFLPVTQKEYLGHIRALIEPDFEFDNNPIIRYLWPRQLRLMPHRVPSFRFDQQAGFQHEMSRELFMYLRREITPIETPTEVLPEPEEELKEPYLLVLDYENLILELGQEGYFFSPEEISRLVVTLLREATEQHAGPVDALAVGHWNRPDLAGIAQMLKERIYELLTIEGHENASEKLTQELAQRLQGSDIPKQIILVAPPQGLASSVKGFTDRGQSVGAWISNLPDADIYQAVVRKYKPLHNVLQLPESREIDPAELENHQAACVLRLDDEIVKTKSGVSSDEIRFLFEQLEQINGRADWWRLWLINQGIVVSDAVQKHYSFRLNSEHPDVIKVRDMRKTVIKTLQALSQDGEGVRQDHLVKELKHFTNLRHAETALSFLELLKEEDIVYRDVRLTLPDSQPLWQLNSSHWAVVALNADRYLPQFALALDHVLVREGYSFMHEHTLTRHIAPYMGDSVAETVYELALTKEWVCRRDSREKRRYRDEYVVNVSLADSHAQVGETMRNRDILLNTLYRKPARGGIRRSALWQKLSEIRSFTLSKDELDQWINFLKDDSIVVVTGDSQDAGHDVVRIDLETLLTQRLLGRIHIHGLVKTMRIMGASRSERKKPSGEVEKRVAKFVTHNDRQLAHWTLEYAKGIRLVKAEGDCVFLNRHSFMRRLDGREHSTCQALAELVKRLSQQRSDGWVHQYGVLLEMEKDPQFGYGRGEHEYWLNQAIHRQKLLEERKERTKKGWQVFVRVLPKKRLVKH
jgi:hypothetical protein